MIPDNVNTTPIYVQQVFDAVKFNMQGMRTFNDHKFHPCIPCGHRIKRVVDIRCRRFFNPANVEDERNFTLDVDTSISGASFLQDGKGNYLKVVGADGTYSERIVYAESSGCDDHCKSTPVFGTHNVAVYGDVTIEIDLLLCDSCGNDEIFTICSDVTIAKQDHPLILTNFFEICVPNSTETVFLPRFTEFCNSSCDARLATNNCGRDLSVDSCGQVTGNLLVAICLTCEKKIVAPVQLCVLSTGYLNAPTQQSNITCSFPDLFPSEISCCRNNLCDHHDDDCCKPCEPCEPCEPCRPADCEKSHRPMPRR